MASEQSDMDKLYEHGENLANSRDKSKNDKDYIGIIGAATGSNKAKLFAAQQLPRFFKYFPQLSAEGINAQLDLCEDDDVNIRITAIRGLPFLCKDNPEHLPKIADVLGQLLIGEDQEHAVVQNSLMQVLRQDPKECLAAIFKHIESSEDKLRENVLAFIKNKVFPNKATLLQPQQEMERHVTDLIKGIQDVTGEEFAMFMNFLTSLNIFGPKASTEQMQELVEIVEGQADLNAPFDGTDGDHLERVMACLQMAVPFFKRGGSNSKFMMFISQNLFPAFDKLLDDKKTELLKNVAEASPHTAPADARTLLPSVVALIKELIPKKKGADLSPVHIEALLYTFNQLAQKTPNATNPLCGYKIVTGQPSDRLGEDFKEVHEEWLARLTTAEEDAKKKIKTVGTSLQEVTKSQRAAKGEEAEKLKEQKADLSATIRACQNIEKLAKGLHSKTPQFIGGAGAPRLSWVPEEKPASTPSTVAAKAPGKQAQTSAKRPQAVNGGAAFGASAKRPRPPPGVPLIGAPHVARMLQGMAVMGRGGRGILGVPGMLPPGAGAPGGGGRRGRRR